MYTMTNVLCSMRRLLLYSCHQTCHLVHVRAAPAWMEHTAASSDIPAVDRRELLSTAAGLGAAAALLPLLVADHAAAAASCDLTGSPSGLQYCDVKVTMLGPCYDIFLFTFQAWHAILLLIQLQQCA